MRNNNIFYKEYCFSDGMNKKHHSYDVNNIMSLDEFPKVKGYDFSKGVDINKILDSYSTTGFQATNLAKAISIFKAMRREKATIFFGFTSNMISSGVREIITFLCKNKMIDVIVTSAGGVEEDIIKCLKPFALGEFHTKGEWLFDHGINRTGNILVPNDRYAQFELFMNPVFEKLYAQQIEMKRPLSPSDICKELGKAVNHKESYLYWAAKNNIPVFCPVITDGSFGDLVYFFKQQQKEFMIDVTEDVVRLVNLGLASTTTGVIVLGAGVVKHHLLNAQIFREGCDYAIFVNTSEEYDGSDSGARPDEAVSWGKIKPKALCVKVHGDATIIFPLIVAGVMGK